MDYLNFFDDIPDLIQTVHDHQVKSSSAFNTNPLNHYADSPWLRLHRLHPQASPSTLLGVQQVMRSPAGIATTHIIRPSPSLAPLPVFPLPLEGTP